MDMSDRNGQVVEEGVSRFGLRRVHVVASGGPVEVGPWVEAYGAGVEGAAMLQYEDADVPGVWHLRLWWKSLRKDEGDEALNEGDEGLRKEGENE